MVENQRNLYLPLLVIAVALCLFFAFHVKQALQERMNLQQTHNNQVTPLAQSKEVQVQLDRIAVATLRLADSGNQNAAALIQKLKQAGITVSAPPPGPIGTQK